MTLNEYLQECLKTWKADQTQEQEEWHCYFSLPEEVGEIAGLYKKIFGYGQEKNEAWKIRLVEECGDLLYYTVVTAKVRDLHDKLFEEDAEPESLPNPNSAKSVKEAIDLLMSPSILMSDFKDKGEIEVAALKSIMMNLKSIILSEHISLETVMNANIAKLRSRHGESFNEGAVMERDKDAELKAIKDAEAKSC